MVNNAGFHKKHLADAVKLGNAIQAQSASTGQLMDMMAESEVSRLVKPCSQERLRRRRAKEERKKPFWFVR